MKGAIEARASRGMVVTADRAATDAGVGVLVDGGSAADAAIAANAVMAVVAPHMCGVGGDLLALVHTGDSIHALNASGRAGSGADLSRLRAEGHDRMPMRGDIRAVTVPGCVDGWLALHDRFGRLPLDRLLGPAVDRAAEGFTTSPLLEACAPMVDEVADVDPDLRSDRARAGAVLTRPGMAESLESIATEGRRGFYGGRFGEGLVAMGAGEFTDADLGRDQADWVDPLERTAWGHRLTTIPPNSQGYLALAGAAVAEGLDLPDHPDDPDRAHLLIEAAKAVGLDRPSVLHEDAAGDWLVGPERTAAATRRIDRAKATEAAGPNRSGDTTYLAVVDGDGVGVSLIQSQAQDFGAHLVVPGTGIFLHCRGLGFSLEPGHPAAYGPGRRPPHTLSPMLVSTPSGDLRAVLGTMGGDAQPQILLQLLSRLLAAGQAPAEVMGGARWCLYAPGGHGFDTWTGDDLAVLVEDDAPEAWVDALAAKGHRVSTAPPWSGAFGHAQLIDGGADRGSPLIGVADPRAIVGAAAGL